MIPPYARQGLRLAVIGSRSFADAELMAGLLRQLAPAVIVSGGARGADSLAADFARSAGIPIEELRPDYQRFGRGAPMRRNADIVARADAVLAFWDGSSKGTAGAVAMAERAGKAFHVVLFVP